MKHPHKSLPSTVSWTEMMERLGGMTTTVFLDGFLRLFQTPLSPVIKKRLLFLHIRKRFGLRRMPLAYAMLRHVSRGLTSSTEQKHSAYGSIPPLSIFCKKGCQGEIAPMGSPPPRLDFKGDVCTSNEALEEFSQLATNGPTGTSWCKLPQPKGSLELREKLQMLMSCLKTPSKFVKSLTCGASTLRARSVFTREQEIWSYSPSLTAYHPQTSGQVEGIKSWLERIIDRDIGEKPASWVGLTRMMHYGPFALAYNKHPWVVSTSLCMERHAFFDRALSTKSTGLKAANFVPIITGDHGQFNSIELNLNFVIMPM
ncbi:hypothetical protein Tco_0751699 [Tanacetum coccineum]|uniref:Uncharacterized protein n=1 Tax=Tanacetum coccineum TaxID=301880 RepID=A0ABQ4Z8A4_9ASTR